MKKFLVISLIILSCAMPSLAEEMLSVRELNKMGVNANSPISVSEYKKAVMILKDVHKMTSEKIKTGSGPFYAVITDSNGKIIAGEANSVVKDNCSCYHAEVNTIRAAQNKLGTYDLAPYNLSIYINAEPCVMCIGAIMWSGIKNVYYSVPSKEVETITGFDEGFKPHWLKEFKNRGISVYGNIIPEAGEAVMQDYVNSGKKIYKPSR